jgi:hypothetical protein
VLPLTALWVAVGFAALHRGGFPAAARAIFVVLAAGALMVAMLHDEREARRALREPAVVVLLVLAAVSTLSAVWTVGEPAEAARWGLVIAGYAAVAVTASVVASGGAFLRVATLIGALALICGALGLLGVALREEPWAERIGGTWRPGGPFEYPPALALLQVSALPFWLRGMVGAPGPRAATAAVGAVVSAMILALSDSRLQVALACTVLIVALVWNERLLDRSRRTLLPALALVAGAAVCARLAAGGYVAPRASGGDVGRALALVAPCVLALVWPWVSERVGRGRGSGGDTPARGGVALAGAGLVVLALLPFLAGSVEGRAVERGGGFAHGRLTTWEAAVETAAERPVLGAGSEGFYTASVATHGESRTRYALNLPLELAVELGIAGLILSVALLVFVGNIAWGARASPALWLLGPAAVGFAVTNLLDWPWHLPGAGAIWAAALGGLVGATRQSDGEYG